MWLVKCLLFPVPSHECECSVTSVQEALAREAGASAHFGMTFPERRIDTFDSSDRHGRGQTDSRATLVKGNLTRTAVRRKSPKHGRFTIDCCSPT